MPVEMIRGHPCKYCDSWSKEIKVDSQYCWVDIGVTLVEKTTITSTIKVDIFAARAKCYLYK